MSPLNHYQSKKKTLYLLLLIWTLALLLASPVALFYKFIWVRDRALGIKPYCTTFNPTFTLTFFKVSDQNLSKKEKETRLKNLQSYAAGQNYNPSMLCNAVQCCAMLYNAVQCCAMLCNAMQCYAMLSLRL